MRKRIIVFLMLLALSFSTGIGETLRYGMTGEEVLSLQQALITQGYLSDDADGIYGRRTEKAVRAYQKKQGLKVDGIAGEKTQAALFNRTTDKEQGYFSGNYERIDNDCETVRIRLLQKALISMNYLQGSADGKYGAITKAAVRLFQKEFGLKQDGIAGEKTLQAMEKAISEKHKASVRPGSNGLLVDGAGMTEAPAKSEIQLLYWYEDIKPALRGKAKMKVYEPVSGLCWTLRLHSKGRHCEAEPLKATDTQIMLKAFGNIYTWEQKGVYVQLPDGRWTIAATCSVPQPSGYIQNNDFDGHLSIHFLRDMEECKEKDPKYGVSNQQTIRKLWKKTTGKTLE